MIKILVYAAIAFLPVMGLFGQSYIKIDCMKVPIIDVTINGKKAKMMIDTGSSINVLDINLIKLYGVKKRFKIGESVDITSNIGVYQLSNYSIKIGDSNVNQFLGIDINKINTISINRSNEVEVVGILGTPAIKELGMVIDLSRGIVTIRK